MFKHIQRLTYSRGETLGFLIKNVFNVKIKSLNKNNLKIVLIMFFLSAPPLVLVCWVMLLIIYACRKGIHTYA